MTLTTVSVAGIESYQPAVDYRKSGRIGLLSARNVAWDASGFYSGYASRLVDGTTQVGSNPFMVQSLDLKEDQHLVWKGNIIEFTPSSLNSPIGSLDQILTLPTLVDSNPANIPYDYRKWTTAYLGADRYACSYNYGVFRVDLTHLPDPTYTRLTSGSISGFPSDGTPVIAIAESNGRMLYLTKEAIYWSAPNDPENLVPAVGGPGFQVINERIGGTPFAMTATAQGAIIWTEVGGLVCEFIGGDFVFRFWVLATQALPISSHAITRMPDDDYVILTRLGLFMFNNLSQPQPIAPLFNEFLREYLRNKPTEVGHVWYSITDNRIYVAMRRPTSPFFETFALEVMLDRWGVFNERHLGLVTYGPARGQFAYVSHLGIVSYFLSPLDARKNRENETSPGTFIGLGASAEIGWIRAENLQASGDPVQELQEIIINRLIPFGLATVTYEDEEFVVIADPDLFDEGFVDDPDPDIFDEGILTEDEAPTDYQLRVKTDLFNFDDLENPGQTTSTIVPEIVNRGRFLDIWSCSASSAYFRLEFLATDPDEFFRVNSLDLTIAYNGQWN